MHCFIGYYQAVQLRNITVNIIMFIGFKIGRVGDNFYAAFELIKQKHRPRHMISRSHNNNPPKIAPFTNL